MQAVKLQRTPNMKEEQAHAKQSNRTQVISYLIKDLSRFTDPIMETSVIEAYLRMGITMTLIIGKATPNQNMTR